MSKRAATTIATNTVRLREHRVREKGVREHPPLPPAIDSTLEPKNTNTKSNNLWAPTHKMNTHTNTHTHNHKHTHTHANTFRVYVCMHRYTDTSKIR